MYIPAVFMMDRLKGYLKKIKKGLKLLQHVNEGQTRAAPEENSLSSGE